ncbi:MAG TPA: hypothetical protein VG435_17005 [Acidimicrobiales bacterium]|nr:hypothetical protein [Acidimicrobiales bacterium]
MQEERFVLLGLAPARAAWFDSVAQWTTSAAIAAEFVKCMSVEEVRTRLSSGRRHSALFVDSSVPAFDRDLIDLCRQFATPVIVVGDRRRGGAAGPALVDLRVAAELPAAFGPDDLIDVLAHHCRPVSTGAVLPPLLADSTPGTFWQAPLVTVSGAGGTGASTIAMAVASGLSRDPRYGGRVLLADLARRADQAMFHDSADLGPGLQELVDAHRTGRPEPDDVAAMTFAVPRRGYHLLLGLRTAESWSALRPRAIDAAVAGLRRGFQMVVADLTGDFEGENDGGSIDVQERNHLARSAALHATVNVVVGVPGLKGTHSLVHTIRSLTRVGVDAERIIVVLNRSPRHPRTRAESGRALAHLLDGYGLEVALAGPVHLPERKLEEIVRDGSPLPTPIVEPVTRAVLLVADRLADTAPPDTGPTRITPGSLGTWAAEDA